MAVMILQFLMIGAVSGYAAYKTLPFLPESWLRERWEESVSRLAPSRRAGILFVCFGASAGVSVSPFAVLSGSPFLIAVLMFLLLQIAYVDITRRVIPDPHLIGIALIAVLTLFSSPVDTFPAAVRFALSAGVLTLLAALPSLFGRPAPLGLGDVKLFAALAFLLGALRPSGDSPPAEDLWPVFSFLLCAFLLNGLFALIALLLRKTKLTGALPMAPAVILAFLIAIAV